MLWWAYLQGTIDNKVYYLNPLEADAFKHAESKTLDIINGLEKEFGTEHSMNEYRNEIAKYGFDATINELKQISKNDNIEEHAQFTDKKTALIDFYGNNSENNNETNNIKSEGEQVSNTTGIYLSDIQDTAVSSNVYSNEIAIDNDFNSTSTDVSCGESNEASISSNSTSVDDGVDDGVES